MKLLDKEYKVDATYDNFMTIPDCWVARKNKVGGGNGEAKLYIGSKDTMRSFYGQEGFVANCFLLKNDLMNYMLALRNEYLHPTQHYAAEEEFPQLWEERMQKILTLEEKIEFQISDQTQIIGPRGYIKSEDSAFQLLRELSLPIFSYIQAIRLTDKNNRSEYYWKLFADFDIMSKENALVYKYGKEKDECSTHPHTNEKNVKEINNARIGQGKYREELLEECPYCPITGISDERLLIASHIKPWAVSNDKEKVDPKNGFMFSPLYDKLFDRGFITFTEDRKIIISEWITPLNKKRMNLVDQKMIPMLPIDSEREKYLKFHRNNVFHGTLPIINANNVEINFLGATNIDTFIDNSRQGEKKSRKVRRKNK